MCRFKYYEASEKKYVLIVGNRIVFSRIRGVLWLALGLGRTGFLYQIRSHIVVLRHGQELLTYTTGVFCVREENKHVYSG